MYRTIIALGLLFCLSIGFATAAEMSVEARKAKVKQLRGLHDSGVLSDTEYRAALRRITAQAESKPASAASEAKTPEDDAGEPPTTSLPATKRSDSKPRSENTAVVQAEFDVAILPFRNASKAEVVDKVYQSVEATFTSNKYRVAPRSVTERVVQDAGIRSTGLIGERELKDIGSRLASKFVVTGTIKRYSSDKKFSLGGFLVSPLGGGATTYGTVEIASEVWDVERSRFAWENSYKTTKKNQVFGLFASKDSVSGRAFDGVMANLFKTFFESPR